MLRLIAHNGLRALVTLRPPLERQEVCLAVLLQGCCLSLYSNTMQEHKCMLSPTAIV